MCRSRNRWPSAATSPTSTVRARASMGVPGQRRLMFSLTRWLSRDSNGAGLFGKNDVERANIDALAEAMIDMMNAVRTFLFDQDLVRRCA